jgi:acyl-CoA thioesterase I
METAEQSPLRYVAMGDSYTIGTAVDGPERWPDQLVAALAGRGRRIRLMANLAVNGFTSGDVIERELPAFLDLDPGFASLLVGVNDVVRAVPHDRFEANAARILDAFLAKLPPDRVLVVTTPDYTVTPEGATYGDPATQRAGIRRNNAILSRLAADRGIAVVDIWDISSAAIGDASLVARDGLHPSGEQYRRWVERILPVAERLLAD